MQQPHFSLTPLRTSCAASTGEMRSRASAASSVRWA